MKIAIAQINPTVGDLTGNAQLILEAAQWAINEDASLLLTPELALIGYPPRDLLIRPSFINAAQQQLEKLAQQLPVELAVLVGTVSPNHTASQLGGKPLFNTAALLMGGEIKQMFHKRLLPTYDVFDEHRYFEPAPTSDFFTLKKPRSEEIVKIGVSICEDLWNDEKFWAQRNYSCDPMKDLSDRHVDWVVNLSGSPYRAGKQKLRKAMLSHSARRYGIPIIYNNQVGANDDLIFDGCSLVINGSGDVVKSLAAFQTDLQIIEWDFNTSTFVGDSANIEDTQLLDSDDEIWQALVLGVKDYTRKCGFSKVVIGLSGGIDSSLVAAIATEALGSQQVLGVLMPSPYSSEHSIEDALDLAKNLGISTQTLPIESVMNAFDSTLYNLFAGTQFGIAEENMQSRIRGTLLMAISNKFGHLLLSTGNKSEIAVGYCTLYGDMNGGLAVIADVPKTRVYSICKWLNESRGREIIPNNVLIKPASAELKPGQFDSDSLPPYHILDDILYRLIERHESVPTIIEAGHDCQTVERIVKLVMGAEFKRRQAPPGLKISDRAFGTGWRMPIARGKDI
ncbi:MULTISPECIES: NAD+ synthase [Arthrospira]|jgi:NAD+ synthase/NAD+ synthase (glutamine-hydrolysing)|uniref:Glutamine-dependent NAD(+) synthetase n=2 Tax=Oscillatoriales TaxID=1150 RepID=A0A5M3TCH8_LIMPL|nr:MULTISPECIES: NAD+ synthase [Arthrospira]AMW27211.1 NAD synthetase [Arthrospira platensis YZ]KDR58841.1 NAD synthetase [Arthrospira platensis str. Paraca]MBD2668618.1 NAD+ synthase [Arthrospira platensis FACHB-439]MBD2709298.1 NAD+ synthase [Arthrospira platensis FACHB-835]MDF2211291.1 NAD+ synthase [Arthrospira platensis NCB002]MDT9181758.1 NAD+ synthase [Limnospira sp. PMC 289.06]MDT9296188.1 NAD+ synthase [Arthrospira platensis PCC 7345]MDT9309354.1 NAD+ synthase [Limnospira sp. Parac